MYCSAKLVQSSISTNFSIQVSLQFHGREKNKGKRKRKKTKSDKKRKKTFCLTAKNSIKFYLLKKNSSLYRTVNSSSLNFNKF